jgi:hypothetical protein
VVTWNAWAGDIEKFRHKPVLSFSKIQNQKFKNQNLYMGEFGCAKLCGGCTPATPRSLNLKQTFIPVR